MSGDPPVAPPTGKEKRSLDAPLLLLTALVIAVCGLVYELLAGTLASYLLGDSITQFSTVIGVYLSAMGLGSWLSGKVVGQVPKRFVEIELAVAVVGGAVAPILFFAFAHISFFRVVLYSLVATVGTLVGLEIPLLLRVLKDRYEFKDLIARVPRSTTSAPSSPRCSFRSCWSRGSASSARGCSSASSTPPSRSGARTCSGTRSRIAADCRPRSSS
jgi:MFS family permease